MLEVFLSKQIRTQVYQEILSFWSKDVFEVVQLQINKVFPPDWNVQLQKILQGIQFFIGKNCTDVQVMQTSHLIRDFCWDAIYKKSTAVVLCRNAEILLADKKNGDKYYPIRIVIQGGHKLSSLEYEFVKKIGVSLGKSNVQLVTGSGGGAMKACMEGAILGYWEGGHFVKKQKLIGLIEKNILRVEFPNEYVNQLVVFSTMEQRLESFFRLSDAIFITVGGVGTLEEILMLLLIQIKNKDLSIPYYFVCSSEQRDFFAKIFSFLMEFVPQKSLWEEKFHCIKNETEQKNFLFQVLQNVEEFRVKVKQHCNRLGVSWNPHWNKFIKIPVVSNKKVNTEIVLEKDADAQKSLTCAYRFFAQIVQHTVSPAEGREKLSLRGDKHLITKCYDLLQFFQEQKKLDLDLNEIINC